MPSIADVLEVTEHCATRLSGTRHRPSSSSVQITGDDESVPPEGYQCLWESLYKAVSFLEHYHVHESHPEAELQGLIKQLRAAVDLATQCEASLGFRTDKQPLSSVFAGLLAVAETWLGNEKARLAGTGMAEIGEEWPALFLGKDSASGWRSFSDSRQVDAAEGSIQNTLPFLYFILIPMTSSCFR